VALCFLFGCDSPAVGDLARYNCTVSEEESLNLKIKVNRGAQILTNPRILSSLIEIESRVGKCKMKRVIEFDCRLREEAGIDLFCISGHVELAYPALVCFSIVCHPSSWNESDL
jgi:hypothetical protein